MSDLSVKIQVIIDVDTAYGHFRDALYFSPDEYSAITEAELSAMKQSRVDAWTAGIANAPELKPPTAEDLSNRAAVVRKDFDELCTLINSEPYALASELVGVKYLVNNVNRLLNPED